MILRLSLLMLAGTLENLLNELVLGKLGKKTIKEINEGMNV